MFKRQDKELIQFRQEIFIHVLKRIKSLVPIHRIPEALLHFKNTQKQLEGSILPNRYFKQNDKYFISLNIPQFPSPAFDRLIDFEIRSFLGQRNFDQLQNAILAITTKCGLRCAHCFEWDNLNVGEKLSDMQLQQIVSDLLRRGVCQIQFSGGEPLNRFNLLESLIAQAAPQADSWILTSGYGLTEQKANRLAVAGCVGISLSCDHYEPDFHNQFRGNKQSFDWVIQAAENANKAGLVVCLTVCLPEDTDLEFLERYRDLAVQLGATFIQLLEPRSAGRYTGKAPILSANQIQQVTDFTFSNNLSSNKEWPLIKFHGAYQRSSGCFGAGNRYLYIDSHGKVHKCPFCQNPNAPDYEFLDETLKIYQTETCELFGAYD